ncbi:MAG: nucleotidyltransferase domain-containing protein [Gammaproteobacteria bacterium]|nr:nucleotidyltransferase domain-containing protein [Gammaproteobacteria bacterium]
MTPSALDPATDRAARRFLALVRASYAVDGAILFGSRARRDHHADSDADVAVLLRGRKAEFLSTKLAMADLAFDVLLETGVRVQPLPVWEEEWLNPERYPNPALLHNIAREGIRL